MTKRRGGRYRMTPARRAALAKAQKASTRKRRKAAIKTGAIAVGKVAGTVAVGAAVWHANSALRNFTQYTTDRKKDVATVKSLFGHGPKVDPNAPGVPTKANRKPLRYYGTGKRVIHGSHTGTRIRSRVR